MSSLTSLISKSRANVIKIDPQARVFSDAELTTFINESQNILSTDFSDDIPEQQKKVTWSIIAWQQEYVLDTVFSLYKKINHVSMDECDISEISDGIWDASRYCIYGTTIYTDTIPSSSKSVTVFYSAALPEITSSVNCTLPTKYDLALVYYASYLALMSIEKTEKAVWCLQMYQQEITRLITDNNRRMTHNFINYSD